MSTGIDYAGYAQEFLNKYGKYANANAQNTNNASGNTNTGATSLVNSVFPNTASNTCSDGADDGKIGFFSAVGNAIEGMGKGIVNCVAGGFTDSEGHFSLLQTAKSVAMGALCFVPVVGPAIGAGLAAYGIYNGAKTVVTAATVASNATTDAEAKAAWEQMGSGALTTGLSVLGAKASAGALRTQLGANTTSTMVQTIRAKGSFGDVARAAALDTKANAVAAAQYAQQKAANGLQKMSQFADDVAENGLTKTIAKRTTSAIDRTKTKLTSWSDELSNKADDIQKQANEQLETAKKNAKAKADSNEASINKAKELAKKHNVAQADCYDNGVPKQIKDGNSVTDYSQNGVPKKSIQTVENATRIIDGNEVVGTETVTISYDSNGNQTRLKTEFKLPDGKKVTVADYVFTDDTLVQSARLNSDGTTTKTYDSLDKNGTEIIGADGKVESKNIATTKINKKGGSTTTSEVVDECGMATDKIKLNADGVEIEHSYQLKNDKGVVVESGHSKTGKSGTSYKTEGNYNPKTKKMETTTTVDIGGQGKIENATWLDKMFAKIDSSWVGDFTSSRKLTPDFIFEHPEIASELSVLLSDEETIKY